MATSEIDIAAASVVRDIGGAQITDLSKHELEAVRTVLHDSLYYGWTDTKTQTRIGQIVGLSKRQIVAVANRRSALIKEGRTTAQADRDASKLATALRKQRAGLIADHEVRKAQTEAQRLLWASEQQSGKLSPYAVRVWRTAKDERRCPTCKTLNGRRMSLKSALQVPPSHPNCRCTMELMDEGVVKDAFVYDEREIVEKVKRVRTPAGARYYKLPVGSPIVPRKKVEVHDFNDLGATWRDNARTEAARKAFRALPPDAMVVAYHGTDQDRADKIVQGGKVNIPSGLHNFEHSVGRTDLYIAPTVADAQQYGDAVVKIVVRKKDIKASIEARHGNAEQAFFQSFDGAVLPAGHKFIEVGSFVEKVRRVRTPAGVRRYKLPIGSPIVVDGVPTQRQLFDVPRVDLKDAHDKRRQEWISATVGQKIDKLLNDDDWVNQVAEDFGGENYFDGESNEDLIDGVASEVAREGGWIYFMACRNMRSHARNIVLRHSEVADPYIDSDFATWGAGPAFSQEDLFKQTVLIMDALTRAPRHGALWRGADLPYEDREKLLATKPGSEVDLPLISFGEKKSITHRFGTSVYFRIEKGARGIRGGVMEENPYSEDADPDRYYEWFDYEMDNAATEVVTGGTFKVLKVVKSKGDDSIVVHLRQTGVFSPRTGAIQKMKKNKLRTPWWDSLFDRSLAERSPGIVAKVRHVRTPAGARRYNLPIGSPIVGHGERHLHLPSTERDFDTNLGIIGGLLGAPDTPASRRDLAQRRLAFDAQQARLPRTPPAPKKPKERAGNLPAVANPHQRGDDPLHRTLTQQFTYDMVFGGDKAARRYENGRGTNSVEWKDLEIDFGGDIGVKKVTWRSSDARYNDDSTPIAESPVNRRKQFINVEVQIDKHLRLNMIWGTQGDLKVEPSYNSETVPPAFNVPHRQEIESHIKVLAQGAGFTHHYDGKVKVGQSKKLYKRGKIETVKDDSVDFGYAELTKEARQRVDEIYTYNDPTTGLFTKVMSADVNRDGDEVEVAGQIRYIDAEGLERSAGSFNRKMNVETGEIYHSYFALNDGHKGQGFMERWFEQVFDNYKADEFTKVGVHANIDVGGYAWARKGFDWERPNEKTLITLVYLADDDNSDDVPDWLRDQAKDLIEKNKTDDLHVWDVASLGREEWIAGDHWAPKPEINSYGEERVMRNFTPFDKSEHTHRSYHQGTYAMGMHVGKAILLGSDWHGHLTFDKDTVKKAAMPTPEQMFRNHVKWTNAMYDKRTGSTFVKRKGKHESDYHLHHFDVDQDDAAERLFDKIVLGTDKETRKTAIRKGRDLVFGEEYKSEPVSKLEPDGDSLHVLEPITLKPKKKGKKGKKGKKK